MIFIDSDWSGFEAELDRLADIPTSIDEAKLNAVMALNAEDVREDVHVDTGALKASVHSEGEVTGDTWRGSVSVGEGLDYAEYERRRSGDHDYMTPNIEMMNARLLAAVKEVISK